MFTCLQDKYFADMKCTLDNIYLFYSINSVLDMITSLCQYLNSWTWAHMDYARVCQLHDRSETDPRECAAWIIISIKKCIFVHTHTHTHTHTHQNTFYSLQVHHAIALFTWVGCYSRFWQFPGWSINHCGTIFLSVIFILLIKQFLEICF